MPKGYIVVTEQVNDPAGMDDYMQAAFPTIVQYEGNPIVFDQSPSTLEGTWHGTQTVILEFASPEAARAWYESPEYQAIVGKRHAAADSNAVILSGIG